MLRFGIKTWKRSVLAIRRSSTAPHVQIISNLQKKLLNELYSLRRLVDDNSPATIRVGNVSLLLSKSNIRRRIALQALSSSAEDVACVKQITHALLAAPFMPESKELKYAMDHNGLNPLYISFGTNALFERNARYSTSHLFLPSDFLQVNNLEIIHLPPGTVDSDILASCHARYICSTSYLRMTSSDFTTADTLVLDIDPKLHSLLKNEKSIIPVSSSAALKATKALQDDPHNFQNYQNQWEQSGFQQLRTNMTPTSDLEICKRFLNYLCCSFSLTKAEKDLVRATEFSNSMLISIEKWAKYCDVDLQEFEKKLQKFWKNFGTLKLYSNIESLPASLKQLIKDEYLQKSKLELSFILGELSKNGDDKNNFELAMKDFGTFQNSRMSAVDQALQPLRRKTLYTTAFQGLGALGSLYLYFVSHFSLYNAFSVFSVCGVFGLYYLQSSYRSWKKEYWKELLEEGRKFERQLCRNVFGRSSFYVQQKTAAEKKEHISLIMKKLTKTLDLMKEFQLQSSFSDSPTASKKQLL
ncbi:mitochondrial MICOS interactor required for cristae morphology Mmc1 [Schizosaccharomyces pombe]|uniref:Meiotically up-regulated gene 99 protein, mitochondrial n=1 Tax=Schizosaccharomyces pombe (strain 972 / ATCC 24843) TaxID=284812 RepID=MUG99_SCHPO|nr:protein mug99 [Schizosaccharomyces pombe]Q9P6M7.1 RecName: Full=Meiotically up-regulated gene 99 protein, mitochondrial; Flags: Precursor [Schizosaccharomyces pombe 972h-]CAB90311.1 meiotically upregulated gene Mug99 [Schizosaccharomyces pombe]|eukprot:NP_593487.1 protein mug99 [Schizosaccharomyces pombe]